MRYHGLAAAMLFSLASVPASAAIVYEQAAGGGGTWTSHINPNGSGFQAFDSFSLGASATITDVRWRGGALTFGAAPAVIDLVDFKIQFWSDAGGTPGSLLASTTVPFGSVTKSSQGIESATGNAIPIEVFEFTTDITPFLAAAGTTYWFSVVADSTTNDPFFVWRPGIGGDGSSAQSQFGAGGAPISWLSRSGDRAYALADGPIDIPVPASAALLLAALAGFAATRRVTADRS